MQNDEELRRYSDLMIGNLKLLIAQHQQLIIDPPYLFLIFCIRLCGSIHHDA